jgi:hypothetical protein
MELLVLAILVLLVILGAAVYLASIPLVWFLVAVSLFFLGLIGPALGCLVLGVIIAMFTRRD